MSFKDELLITDKIVNSKSKKVDTKSELLHPLFKSKEFRSLLKAFFLKPLDLFHPEINCRPDRYMINKKFLEEKIFKCGRKKLNRILKTLINHDLICMQRVGNNYLLTINNYLSVVENLQISENQKSAKQKTTKTGNVSAYQVVTNAKTNNKEHPKDHPNNQPNKQPMDPPNDHPKEQLVVKNQTMTKAEIKTEIDAQLKQMNALHPLSSLAQSEKQDQIKRLEKLEKAVEELSTKQDFSDQKFKEETEKEKKKRTKKRKEKEKEEIPPPPTAPNPTTPLTPSINSNQKNIMKNLRTGEIPTCQEVMNFFLANGFDTELGKKAFYHYKNLNWHDKKGNKIDNWRQKMEKVWFKNNHEKKEKHEFLTENDRKKREINMLCRASGIPDQK